MERARRRGRLGGSAAHDRGERSFQSGLRPSSLRAKRSKAIQRGLSRSGLLRRFALRNDEFVSESRKKRGDILAEIDDGVAAFHHDQRRDAERGDEARQFHISRAFEREIGRASGRERGIEEGGRRGGGVSRKKKKR